MLHRQFMLLMFNLMAVMADYTLQVTVTSLCNAAGHCADQRCQKRVGVCCDSLCPSRTCDYVFSLCLRPLDTPVSEVANEDQGDCELLSTGVTTNRGEFFYSMAPVVFNGSVWPPEGMQLFIELIDMDDGESSDDLIDRFTTDISNELAGAMNISGQFQLAEIRIDYNLSCSPDSNVANYTCGPGFTGVCCGTRNDGCVGSGSGATCGAGDPCIGVNCNGGTCVVVGQEMPPNFRCECPPRYTGQFCESKLNTTVLSIGITSFNNPRGQCADAMLCSEDSCCQGHCSSKCNYFLYLCLRPSHTPVSNRTEAFQGGDPTFCVKTGTVENGFTSQSFSSPGYLLGIPNPWRIEREQWPSDGVQVYVELLHEREYGENGLELANCLNCTLIDRFTYEIQNPTTDDHLTLYGQFKQSNIIVLNYTAACNENFYGTNCEIFCAGGCQCNPGFQIDFPSFNAEDCKGDDCGEKQICLDSDNNTRTCSCTGLLTLCLQSNVREVCLPLVVTIPLLLTATLVVVTVVLVLARKKTASLRAKSQPVAGSVNKPELNYVVVDVSESSAYRSLTRLGRRKTRSASGRSKTHRTISRNKNSGQELVPFSYETPCNDCIPIDEPSSVSTAPSSYGTGCGEVLDTADIAVSPESNSDFTLSHASSSTSTSYDYTPSASDYDYKSPFWKPSGETNKLLDQFKKLEIRSILQKELEEKSVLGNGAFGIVYKGLWRHKVANSDQLIEEEVAVKTMEAAASEEDRIRFLQEAAIMGQFDHPNIVKIMGIMLKDEKCKIIMEFMTIGNFNSHLPSLKMSQSELASQLLFYSRQVASGMNYLALKGYVHRDLAARNVLVSKDDVCKIADFGLSRDLQNEGFYKSHGGKIPVKWTAPEALNYRLYSHASDVWSYGVLLYEIWTLGVRPYSDLNNVQVIAKLSDGYRLPPPPGCPRAIYDVMIKCWNDDPKLRPGFSELCALVSLPEFKVLKWSEEDLARYGEEARTIGAPLAEGETLFAELQNTYAVRM